MQTSDGVRAMKNAPQTGHSAKRGNAASPYLKYNKRPYVYGPAYQAWRRTVVRQADKDKSPSQRTVRQ